MKFLTILTFLILPLFGFEAKYEARFPILGTIGTFETKLKNLKRGRYEINTEIKLSGIAKYLMDMQVERHISKGHYEKGVMVSDLYQKILRYNKTVTNTIYRLNHKRKKITKTYQEWKNGKLIKNRKRTIKFYTKDDLLTLFYNIKHKIKRKGKTYMFKAVGLEKQKGRVYMSVPSKANEKPYRDELGDDAKWYFKALIHQKNFKKKKGDVFVSLDKDGYIKKSVIKDVILYGDVTINRVY